MGVVVFFEESIDEGANVRKGRLGVVRTIWSSQDAVELRQVRVQFRYRHVLDASRFPVALPHPPLQGGHGFHEMQRRLAMFALHVANPGEDGVVVQPFRVIAWVQVLKLTTQVCPSWSYGCQRPLVEQR